MQSEELEPILEDEILNQDINVYMLNLVLLEQGIDVFKHMRISDLEQGFIKCSISKCDFIIRFHFDESWLNQILRRELYQEIFNLNIRIYKIEYD